jgi:hypothetical protein
MWRRPAKDPHLAFFGRSLRLRHHPSRLLPPPAENKEIN